MLQRFIFVPLMVLVSTATYASAKNIDASACLQTRVQVGQEIGNVFGRTVSFQVEGFDPYVLRVSGTGFYKVEKVTPEQIEMDSSFLYDGSPLSHGTTVIEDEGRTSCWKGKCTKSIDASGVFINPLLWGSPKGKLHVGDTWTVDIPIPWELGPAGKQIVKVVSIDPANATITLEREGEGAGDAVGEFKHISLTKDKKSYSVGVAPGKATWSGYTTFRHGIVMSDTIFVTRPITITSKDFGQLTGTERQYIFLNAAPPDPLHS